MTGTCRFATIEDWPLLRAFYDAVYRAEHPLQNIDFWRWQYGDPQHGQVAIVVADDGRVVGHLGAALSGGFSWIINCFLMEECRGQGWLRELYGLTRTLAPNAATNINRAGLDMYRRMGFKRYADLQRYTAVAPGLEPAAAVAPASITTTGQPQGHHYWLQPGIVGTTLGDGSTAVVQADVGGLRVVHVADPSAVLAACWETGARWADFITSWSDPLCRDLDRKRGWTLGDVVPWRLNPLERGSRSGISVTCETVLPTDLVIDRTFSDHGRVGSLQPTPLDTGEDETDEAGA